MITLLTENVVEIIPKHLLLLLLLSVVKKKRKEKKITLNSSIHSCASSQCVARKALFTAPERLVVTGWRNGPPQPVKVSLKGESQASALTQKVLVGPPLAWRLQQEMPFTL